MAEKTKVSKVNLVYDRRKQQASKGVGLIEIYIYFPDKKKTYTSTNIFVASEEWDSNKKQINDKHTNSIKLNKYLRDQIESIREFELDLISRDEKFTVERFRMFLEDGASTSFLKFARRQLRNSPDLELSSVNAQTRSLNTLERLIGDVTIHQLSPDLLRKLTKEMKKEYSDWTIWRTHKDIKKFVNEAVSAKLIKRDDNPYYYYAFKKPQSKHKYLNYEELKALEELSLPTDEMTVYRDMFLFSCYTGLRVGDLLTLDGTNVFMQSGELVLKIPEMQKVSRKVFQKMSEILDGKAIEIIRPYWDKNKENLNLWGNKKRSDVKLNKLLKIFQSEAEIKKTLTAHVGRHTFGTIYAHKCGSYIKVMDAMGISKPETASIYISLSLEL